MPAATIRLPFNLNAWIKENLPKPLGSIGNKDVFEEDMDMIFQIIKGPNERNDFHICPSDEIFYQRTLSSFLLPPLALPSVFRLFSARCG
jgi:3-hydroxyanthranilic acid dioxygenase